MNTIRFDDGTELNNVVVGLSRGILTIHYISLPIREAVNLFLDENKTKVITNLSTGDVYEGYTRLIALTNREIISIKMSQEE